MCVGKKCLFINIIVIFAIYLRLVMPYGRESAIMSKEVRKPVLQNRGNRIYIIVGLDGDMPVIHDIF